MSLLHSASREDNLLGLAFIKRIIIKLEELYAKTKNQALKNSIIEHVTEYYLFIDRYQLKI